jgi:hypothetical protein
MIKDPFGVNLAFTEFLDALFNYFKINDANNNDFEKEGSYI